VLDSAGGGALTLTGANTYTGYTTVDGGTLAVAPGGSITGSSLLTVDAQGASPATVTLASGANLSTGTALIGVFATGTVTQSGGSFTNGGSLYLAYYSSGTGTYDLNGGVLTTGSVVGGDGAGTFNFNGGTLQAGGSNLNFFSGVSTASVQAGGAIIDTQGYNVTVAQNLVSGVNVKNLTVFTSAVAPTTDGGLTKLGTGTLTLTGASSYTGPTMVSAGTLAVNGSLTGTGMLTVFSAATLAGTGSVAGNVSIQANGTLAPGQAGAGTLSLDGNLTLTGTATAAFVLSGTAGNTQADAAGQINLGSQATLSLSLATGSPLTVGEKFYLLDTTGTSLVLGGFSNAPLTGSVFSEDGVTYQIDYLDTDPNDPGKTALNDVSVTILAIPEPGTWTLLFVGGTAMLGVALRRKRRRTQRLRSPDPCF
jgi:autotransporter-associated beta strand protein